MQRCKYSASCTNALHCSSSSSCYQSSHSINAIDPTALLATAALQLWLTAAAARVHHNVQVSCMAFAERTMNHLANLIVWLIKHTRTTAMG
jgi:hypothetical protein